MEKTCSSFFFLKMFHLSLSAFACGIIGGGGGGRGGRRGVMERILDVMLVVGDLKEKEPMRGKKRKIKSYSCECYNVIIAIILNLLPFLPK